MTKSHSFMMGDRSSLRDTAILEHYGLRERERFSWKVVSRGTAEKKEEMRMNSATLFPRRRPAATLIAILDLSARSRRRIPQVLPDRFMRLWSHPSPRVANWRHHEVDRATSQKERDRWGRMRSRGSEIKGGKNLVVIHMHARVILVGIDHYKDWYNILDIVELSYKR